MQSEYARIKVLTEKGRIGPTGRWILTSPDIWIRPSSRAATIHADGTVIPLVGKASDLLVAKTNSYHMKSFRLQSATASRWAAFLEYKWSLPLTGGKVSGVADQADEGYYAAAMAGRVPDWEVQAADLRPQGAFLLESYNDLEMGPIG